MDDIPPCDTLGDRARRAAASTSGFFSLAETAMMAANRYRLSHRAQRGERGARLALALLAQTDTLLGVILLGNNLINAGAATLDRGDHRAAVRRGQARARRWARSPITFLILVFSEITPKVDRRRARRPHRAARRATCSRRC